MSRIWTQAENEFLEENFKTKTPKYIATILGRSYSGVANKVRALKAGNKVRSWNEEDVRFLQENKNRLTSHEIADRLGRNVDSVSGKMASLATNYTFMDKTPITDVQGVYKWLDLHGATLIKPEAISKLLDITQVSMAEIPTIERIYDDWRSKYMRNKTI